MSRFTKYFTKISVILLMIGVTLVSGACGFFGRAGVPNPWAETDHDGIKAASGFDVNIPEEAVDAVYRYNSTIRLSEIQYRIGTVRYCVRMRSCDSYEDISGLYYQWTTETDVNDIPGAEAKCMKYYSDNEMINVVSAYYPDTKMQYCLSAISDGETVGNIISMARSVWNVATELPTEEPIHTEEPQPTEEPETDPYAKILEFAQSFVGKDYGEITEILGEPLSDEITDGIRTVTYDEFYFIIDEEETASEAGLNVKPEETTEPESEATPEC